MRHLRQYNQEQTINVIDLALPFKVQAPTFASVSEAYAYFTRYQDKYAVPDYADDSDDVLPQFVTPDEADDFFVAPPVVDDTSREADPPSSPEAEDGDDERSEETTDDVEG